jgi:hypothetical protein
VVFLMMAKPQALAELVFQAALELEPSQRTAYVESACGGDVDLHQCVEARLAEYAVWIYGSATLRRDPVPRAPDPLSLHVDANPSPSAVIVAGKAECVLVRPDTEITPDVLEPLCGN